MVSQIKYFIYFQSFKICWDWFCDLIYDLLLGRKVMTNLDSIFKSRDITLPTKVHLVKAMVFPVVMYGCASWTVKKTERRRIDAFELWCWRRLLRVPWTARRSNQSILKIGPECSLEGLMLKLKLQYFGHLMRRTSVTQSYPTLCDLMNHITSGLLTHHQLPESTQTHIHWVGDAIQPSHPLLSPSPPAFNLSQHQGLFQWVSSLHQVAKILEFQLQHQSFQWIFRTDFL